MLAPLISDFEGGGANPADQEINKHWPFSPKILSLLSESLSAFVRFSLFHIWLTCKPVSSPLQKWPLAKVTVSLRPLAKVAVTFSHCSNDMSESSIPKQCSYMREQVSCVFLPRSPTCWRSQWSSLVAAATEGKWRIETLTVPRSQTGRLCSRLNMLKVA